MKKLLAFLLALVIFSGFVSVYIINLPKMEDMPENPQIGYTLSKGKFNSVDLIAKNLDKNTLLVLGSSELGTDKIINSHPGNLFFKNGYDFNTMLVGVGYYQSLSHSIMIGALDDKISKNKLALIVSPQWFAAKEGISSDAFKDRYSKTMLVSFMKNNNISKELKEKLKKRLVELNVSVPNSITNKILELQTRISIKKEFLKPYPQYMVKNKMEDIDWNDLKDKAVEEGKKACTNNEYGVYNEYYNKYIASKYDELKNSSTNDSFLVSKEYDDFQLFLEVCKKIKVDPLIVIVPVNGLWYDYIGFSKDDRQNYYKNIKLLCDKYEVEYADFSDKEYEKYFLCDIMHLGWKGWVHINEAFCKFYQDNEEQ